MKDLTALQLTNLAAKMHPYRDSPHVCHPQTVRNVSQFVHECSKALASEHNPDGEPVPSQSDYIATLEYLVGADPRPTIHPSERQ